MAVPAIWEEKVKEWASETSFVLGPNEKMYLFLDFSFHASLQQYNGLRIKIRGWVCGEGAPEDSEMASI